MEFYIVEAFKIFEKIVNQNLFQNYLLDPSKIFDLPDFNEWIKSFRWVPKKSAQNEKKYDYSIEKFFEDIEDDIHFLYALLSINSNDLEEKKTYYFMPFLCSDKEIYTDLPKQFKSSFNIKTESDDGEIYLYQAEYYRVFWKNLFNQTSRNKKFRLIMSKENEEFLSAIRNKAFNIDVLGGGDTTNVVLNFQISGHEPILCKIYKNTSLNLEIPVLNHLLKTNFSHIPQIFGSIGISTDITTNERRNVKVLFREFLESQNDAGSIFWNELNDHFLSYNSEIPKYSSKYSQNMFKTLFPKSSSYASKIGDIISEMHEKLRTQADVESELSSNKNNNSVSLSNFFIEDEFDENDLLALRNLLIDIMQDIYSQIKLLNEPNSKENNSNNIAKSIQNFIESLIPENLINSPYLNKQPIHQDLHFSQMIQIDDLKRDPIFIDFEGDPLLPESYKFNKYPYFQDIASTLRAFSYIKFNMLINPIGRIFESKKIFDIFSESHFDGNSSNSSSKNSIIQCSLGMYLLSNLKKQKSPKLFMNFIESLMVDFSKSLNIDLSEINKLVGKIQEIEEFKDILSFSKYWQGYMSNRILHGYFSKSNQNEVKSKEMEHQKNRVLKIFLFRRALFELKYERTYRPMNQIVPILGLMDLFLEQDLFLSN